MSSKYLNQSIISIHIKEIRIIAFWSDVCSKDFLYHLHIARHNVFPSTTTGSSRSDVFCTQQQFKNRRAQRHNLLSDQHPSLRQQRRFDSVAHRFQCAFIQRTPPSPWPPTPERIPTVPSMQDLLDTGGHLLCCQCHCHRRRVD